MHTEQEIDAAINRISGGTVLDVATGPGSMITWMVEALKDFETITGIDAVDITERLDGKASIFDREDVHFQQMDAHAMTFADASFDTVTIANSLHHMADPGQVLAEIARVLKPGGTLIVQEMYRDNQTAEQRTHIDLHHWWAAIDRARGITHNETFTRQALLDLLGESGLVSEAVFDFADLESDPYDSERLAFLHNRLDEYLAHAEQMPDFAAIQTQAEELRGRLETVGFRGATALIVLARKE
ncbi:MAG: methyltransferase domain-containing protein [Chloroflexi bacterium]|nr:methyltransferase domain-containing protein [Chloroflexota bacterium]